MSTNGPGGEDAGGRPADDGEAYHEDADVRERYVLYCLSRHGRMSLWDLADEVTVWETRTRLPDLPPSEGRKVYLALYHTHVPRLERAGLVDYLPKRDLVALSDASLGVACRKPPRPEGADGRVRLPYER